MTTVRNSGELFGELRAGSFLEGVFHLSETEFLRGKLAGGAEEIFGELREKTRERRGKRRRSFQLKRVAGCLAWEELTEEFIQLKEEIIEERGILRYVC